MQNQRMMSFDVGIKNMAYCIFEIDGSANPFKIVDWNVLNLMEKEESHVFCNCSATKEKSLPKVPKKPKKIVVLENFFVDSSNSLPIPVKLCGKAAKYKKGDSFFCEKHAKLQTKYIVPTKKISVSQLKKQKIDELLKITEEYHVLEGEKEKTEKKTKKSILETLDAFFTTHCLESIVESKKKTAGDTDLISIGKNMKLLLNMVDGIEHIHHVIIENQISTLANRMKTIQGMLAQYFIMKNSDIKIDFVSSFNKLKGFSERIERSEGQEKTEKTEKTEKQKYKQHKNDGVFYTNGILEKNEWLSSWIPHFHASKKKDDLADSFLQGFWFLKSRENCKIDESLQISKIY